MTIDKFGRSSTRRRSKKSKLGFKLTTNGNIDFEGRTLTNIGIPLNDNDSVPRFYVYNFQNQNKLKLENLEQNMEENVQSYVNNLLSQEDSLFRSQIATKNYIDSEINKINDKFTQERKILNEDIKKILFEDQKKFIDTILKKLDDKKLELEKKNEH